MEKLTDRELLELAAKAAGEITPSWYGNEAFLDGLLSKWNPLTDDGDALRLAIKLGVLLDVRYTDQAMQRHNRVTYWIDPEHGLPMRFDDCGADLATATRRAIVRAAAEIGKTIK